MAALTSSENTLLGSLSNDDGDVTENGKRSIGLDKEKKPTLHGPHALIFCTFLCRHCTTTT